MANRQIIWRVAVIGFMWGLLSWEIVHAAPVAKQELSESEIASFGCIAGGTGMLTAGYWAGPSEAIMLWGGGLLVPSGNTVLAISMLGALGAAGCSVGATLAPTVIWISEQVDRLISYLASEIR